jgi:ankyrin repeat protein
LLRTGGDIQARDSIGRSATHFAACGPSSILLSLMIATRPESVNDLDHKRRSPLHYCVWNSASNQVDLLRTLLDFNSNPNVLDEDLRTPLHHASEGGRTRAIPILLQRGALQSMSLKDHSGKCPLELAQNDRTRELLIVYSAAPLNHR